MGTRNHLAGAYRRAVGDSDQADVETFAYAAGDILLGQHGWTLTSMHQADPDSATALKVTGRWEHPLHRGNWHRIVCEHIEISQTTDQVNRRVTFRAEGDDLAVTHNGRTTRRYLPDHLLVPNMHACLGPMIETASGTAQSGRQTSVVVVGVPGASIDNPLGFACVTVAAERIGRAVVETPDGQIRADEYSVHFTAGEDESDGRSDAQAGWWKPSGENITARWYVGGDGMLAAYTEGDVMVWRAALAPSRA